MTPIFIKYQPHMAINHNLTLGTLMNNMNKLLTTATMALALTACNDSDDTAPVDQTPEVTTYGPLSTGSVSEPVFAYFDLETMSTVTLTDEEAATDTTWDIAFKRSGVYLNNASETPVSAYFTGKNADFFDADGNAVSESFVNATPETELENFTSVTADDIPADEAMFVADVTNNIINDWYNYDSTTHQVSAASDKYFIVNSDETLTKFSVSDLTQAGFSLSDITISYANQTAADTAFATTTSTIEVNASEVCGGFGAVYLDFDLGQAVAEGDNWDVTLSCNSDNTGVNFAINIADDATAMQDFDNYYDAVDVAAINYYDFQNNEYTIKAFGANPWYQYGVNGGHTLWSQYGVYLIKTDTATYKLQITSYYDSENVSGNISFRAESL